MEIENKNIEIQKIEKYPSWCKDDIDKAIHEILCKNKVSRTALLHKISERVIYLIAKESLNERLDRLYKEGIIKNENMLKEFKVISLK